MVILLTALGLAASAGCQQPPQVAPAQPPAIPVGRPVQREVTDYVDYTGRADAVESVGIRARVTGYIDRVRFQEGAEVKKGDVLFEIDPRPYQDQLDEAESQVRLNQASLKLAQTTYARDRAIANSGVAGAVSPRLLDQDMAAVQEAGARIQASQAAVKVYRLNLDFCKVARNLSRASLFSAPR
jgi:multidrug efflux system membrane fusion protein